MVPPRNKHLRVLLQHNTSDVVFIWRWKLSVLWSYFLRQARLWVFSAL